MQCIFEEAWAGQCKEEAVGGTTLCQKHTGLTCCSCGAIATRTCAETFTLICGCTLCDDCEHEIAPDGTNGGNCIHVRKGAQRYKLWMMQNAEERLRGEYLMAKRYLASIERLAPELKDPEGYLAERRPGVLKKLSELEADHPELVGLEEA